MIEPVSVELFPPSGEDNELLMAAERISAGLDVDTHSWNGSGGLYPCPILSN